MASGVIVPHVILQCGSMYRVTSGIGGPGYSSDTKRRKTDSAVSCSSHFKPYRV